MEVGSKKINRKYSHFSDSEVRVRRLDEGQMSYVEFKTTDYCMMLVKGSMLVQRNITVSRGRGRPGQFVLPHWSAVIS